MTELSAIQDSDGPMTVECLCDDLKALGLRSGETVLVHSSLSALGFVSGGAQAVLEALIQTLGEAGTLVLPAHSAGLSDPANWSNPPVPEGWWETIRASMPAFDPALTPTRAVGVIPELFRSLPGVERGRHPAYSFAARGPLAESIVAEQSLEDPFGEGSPLSRLAELDASILLLGVGYDSCTTLHLAERRAQGKHPSTIRTGAPIRENGKRIWKAYNEPEVSSDDFAQLGESFETASGSTGNEPSIGRIGRGDSRHLPSRALLEYATPWFREHRIIQA